LKDTTSTSYCISFGQRMVLLGVVLVVIVFVGSEIWVSRYGTQITDRVVAAYSILAVFGFIVTYLYRRPKYASHVEPTKK